MIYVVSGGIRSGTSMMMQCFQAGGIPPYYNEKLERQFRRTIAKERNPGGYFEVTLEEKSEVDFPLLAEGMAVKIQAPWNWIGNMAVHEYRVILLERDPVEIQKSLLKIRGGILTPDDIEQLRNYKRNVVRGIEMANNRKDIVSLDVVNYVDVLNDPLNFFRSLDWPIDAVKAASIVNPQLRTCAA